jgi:hypothetical protein
MTRSRAISVAALAIAALWSATELHAQLPMAPSTVFEMTGFIQRATLDAGTDPFRGGTITLNNHVVKVPRNTIFQMPAASLTWAELFTRAPAPYAALGQTGVALNDTPKPAFTFEVTVQGNRVEPAAACGPLPAGTSTCYIAGLIFIDQLSLQAHQGFINFIDYTVGEMRVGGTPGVANGTRVRINDPKGRFGRVLTHDARFTIDEENPTIKTETGFPMCLPRVAPPAANAPETDVLCPQGNRPRNNAAPAPGAVVAEVNGTSGAYKAAFTMASRPAPTAAEIANNGATRATPDAWRMAPFEIGDYVTVKGPLVNDVLNGAPSQYIDAWGIDASVGIFTVPGTLPNYVAIDVLLMGTGPVNDPTIAQEGARRTRVEGFTTDISTAIMVSAVDVEACTGGETDRVWTLQAVDPGPPNGAVAGRWRFRPGAPLFDLKGFPFLPPTREVHAVSTSGSVTTLNGLNAGQYQAPNFEFILPENLGIGSPKIPANFEGMPFLVDGSGPRAAFGTGANLGRVGQLSPWPGATAPAAKVCP